MPVILSVIVSKDMLWNKIRTEVIYIVLRKQIIFLKWTKNHCGYHWTSKDRIVSAPCFRSTCKNRQIFEENVYSTYFTCDNIFNSVSISQPTSTLTCSSKQLNDAWSWLDETYFRSDDCTISQSVFGFLNSSITCNIDANIRIYAHEQH